MSTSQDSGEMLRRIMRRILGDIRVEMTEEFDRNFEREAFFSERWQRRRSPTRPGGHILVETGQLRRSIRSVTSDTSIRFFTTLPYAAIHNDGGEIRVTARMKRFFWHKYYETASAFGRRKNGALRRDKRTVRLTAEAEFWKCMALKKEGTKIVIPRRRFLGAAPEVEQAVKKIIEDNLEAYFNNDYKL